MILTYCLLSLCSQCFCADTRYPERRREHRIGRAAHGGEQHQAAADGDTEEGLQEPDGDAAHLPRRRSLRQDFFPRIDEDTKGSVDCLL